MKDLKVEVKDNTTPSIYNNGNLLISDEGQIIIVTSNSWEHLHDNKFKGTILNDVHCIDGHYTPGSNHEWLKGKFKQFYGEVTLSMKDPSVIAKRLVCPSSYYSLCGKTDTDMDNILTCLDKAVAKVKSDFVNSYNLGLLKAEARVQLKVSIETERTDVELTKLQEEEAERTSGELYRKYINQK